MRMLGGWLAGAVDQRWTIIGSKGPVHAVTGIRDIHIVSPEERTKVFAGCVPGYWREGCERGSGMGVEPGDPVVPDVGLR